MLASATLRCVRAFVLRSCCVSQMNLYLRHLDQSGSGSGQVAGMQQMLGELSVLCSFIRQPLRRWGRGTKCRRQSHGRRKVSGKSMLPYCWRIMTDSIQVAALVNAMNSNLSNCFLKLEKYQLAAEKAGLVRHHAYQLIVLPFESP